MTTVTFKVTGHNDDFYIVSDTFKGAMVQLEEHIESLPVNSEWESWVCPFEGTDLEIKNNGDLLFSLTLYCADFG